MKHRPKNIPKMPLSHARISRQDLMEKLLEQKLATLGGHRGRAFDIAVYYPQYRLSKRDRIVKLASGEEAFVPYHILDLPKPDADRWISQNLGAENLSAVQVQLVTEPAETVSGS